MKCSTDTLPVALALFLGVAAWFAPHDARAEDARSSCQAPKIARQVVGRCAALASAKVAAEREGQRAAEARRSAASPWFPSNPTLSLSGARRAATEGRAPAFNAYASLAQEIEIAGQRGLRKDAASAEIGARQEDTRSALRAAAAAGYRAWFEVVAAREALGVARRLEANGTRIATVARARSGALVGSALEAEMAEAAALRLAADRVDAEHDLEAANITLATVLGRDPSREPPSAEGDLEPLQGSTALASQGRSTVQRPEVRALQLEQRSFEARADVLRRSRVPNLTLQLFAQNDGYDEKVFGAGLSVPLPLPEPLGRLRSGEIDEATALGRRASLLAVALDRQLSSAFALAASEFRARSAQAALYTEERAGRVEALLAEIGKEIDLGRLPVQGALLAQAQLIDVLRTRVATRRALCLASVDLAVLGGVRLEEEPR